MVEYLNGTLDEVFGALADPTRRSMLDRVRRGAATVSELAAPHAMSLAAASKHVKRLERAGLLRREVRGREHVLTLNALPLATAETWVSRYRRFWEERLDALARHLEEPPNEEGGR